LTKAEKTGGAIAELQKRVYKEVMRRMLRWSSFSIAMRHPSMGGSSAFPFQTRHKATIEGLFNFIPHYFHLSLHSTTKGRGLKKRLARSAALARISSNSRTIYIPRSQSEDRLRLPNSSVLAKRYMVGR
jgi:hypothetical protein